MSHVVVTGHRGFIGRNLCAHLDQLEVPYEVLPKSASADLAQAILTNADVVVHLAGVNRADKVAEFESGNANYTRWLCEQLSQTTTPALVFASSIQAEEDNPYGRSKLVAERIVEDYGRASDASAHVLRLKNVFGKWCKPNYNSVVATFCHNVANGIPLHISDPTKLVDFVYVDDVVNRLLGIIRSIRDGQPLTASELASYPICLEELATIIEGFRDMPRTLELSDFSDRFSRCLYATFLTYKNSADWNYRLDQKTDARGTLAEFVKSESLGQIFVSRTVPGATRGDHYHHTKTEKFLVLNGHGTIRMRAIAEPDSIIEIDVSGEQWEVIDIPPGYTHSITNSGHEELITLFWASEPFDEAAPDTFRLPVTEELVVGPR